MIDLCCEFSYKKAISNKLSLPRKGFNKACLGPHGNKPVSLKLLLHRSTRKLPVFDSARIHVNMKSLVELGETGVCPNHPHIRQQPTTVESYTTQTPYCGVKMQTCAHSNGVADKLDSVHLGCVIVVCNINRDRKGLKSDTATAKMRVFLDSRDYKTSFSW